MKLTLFLSQIYELKERRRNLAIQTKAEIQCILLAKIRLAIMFYAFISSSFDVLIYTVRELIKGEINMYFIDSQINSFFLIESFKISTL